MKRPAFQFYPADWRKDAELQSCSVAARGLWLEMMCVMHECTPYGHLTVNGAAMSDAQAARLCGTELREYRRLLAELDRAGVASRTAEGVIYSRRMVRDEDVREKRANGGQEGGKFGHLGAKHGAKGGRPRNETGVKKPPLQPPPSSSSSSSSSIDTSVGVSTPEVRDASPPRKRGHPRKTPLPDGFAISDRVQRWAIDKGHRRIAERFEHFVGRARQHGYVYADWDEALMTAIREDWARLADTGPPRREPTLTERKASTIDRIIARGEQHGTAGRIIDIAAERVDREAVQALPGNLRKSG